MSLVSRGYEHAGMGKHFFEKLLLFLRAKPFIGGLEISDSGLRFAHFDGAKWHLTAMRLPPGIVEAGKIKDYQQYVSILKKFHAQITEATAHRKKIIVSVSLSSVSVYTQIFTLPVLKGESFERAVELNLQMVSPGKPEEMYSGWQLVSEDPSALKLEVLSSFVSRAIIDELIRALGEAGFFVLAIESRALSIGRLIRILGVGVASGESYAVLHLDNDALDFLIVRKGQVYFDYFSFWTDLNAEGRHIRLPDFESAIVRNLHQMVTFYNQHWQEPLAGVFVITLGLKDEVTRIIRENFPLQIHELQLNLTQPVGPEWLVALGGGLRGLIPRKNDTDISLTKVGTQEEFHREQLAAFFRFWRVAAPAVLLVLFGLVFGVHLYLMDAKNKFEQGPLLKLGQQQATELESLQNRAQTFNHSVDLIQSLRRSTLPNYPVLDTILRMSQAHRITLRQFSFTSAGAETSLTGEAATQDDISNFKKAFVNDPQFGDVRLPPTARQPINQGFSFTMTFIVNSVNSPSKTP